MRVTSGIVFGVEGLGRLLFMWKAVGLGLSFSRVGIGAKPFGFEAKQSRFRFKIYVHGVRGCPALGCACRKAESVGLHT